MTLDDYLKNPPALKQADYHIWKYTDEIYKIVHFLNPRDLVSFSAPKLRKEYSGDDVPKKYDSSLSRARRKILEYALCNDWKYFCTFTLDQTKYDRYNLQKWHKDFMQWLRDYRKKLKKNGQDLDIQFLLVPEKHENGAWHMHGLFSDISPVLLPFSDLFYQGLDVPYKLVEKGYLNWPDYQSKFGYCSFGVIKNPVAVSFYITKYITEQLSDLSDMFGFHLYYVSRGLNSAVRHGECFGDNPYLNSFLDKRYDFIETGMTNQADFLDWSFALDFMDSVDYVPISVSIPCFGSSDFDGSDCDDYYSFAQMMIDNY